MIDKTRNLSVYEYLKELQIEYIVFELRKKIYSSSKDKNYFDKVLGFKKPKIEDIALRNSLKTIFENLEMKKSYSQKVYREGYPDFHYKTEEQREEFENKDLQYYYAIGSDVRFFVEGEAHVGKVKSFDLEVHVLQVSEDGAEDVWEFDESDYQTIIRIL